MNRGSLVTPAALAVTAVLLAAGCAPQTKSDTTRDLDSLPASSAGPVSPSEVAPSAPPRPTGDATIIPPDSASQSPTAEPDGADTPSTPSSPDPSRSPVGTARGSVKVVDTVATDIPIPWGMARLPDGTVLVTSRDEHHLYRVAPKAGKVVDLGEIPGVVSDGGEGGLLGVAVSSYYPETKRIFLYYSTSTDNRIATVTLQPGSPATLSDPRVVFSGIPRGFRHNGGRIAFGPDDMLYVGTGETEVPALAQDTSSLGRAQLDPPRPQLRLAREPGRHRPEGRDQPDRGVRHRRGLSQRRRDGRWLGLHGRAQGRASLADPPRRHQAGRSAARIPDR